MKNKAKKCMECLFSPFIRRTITDNSGLANSIKSNCLEGKPLAEMFPDLDAAGLEAKSKDLAKSLNDIEGVVEFQKNPFRRNQSPFILDSADANMFELDNAEYIYSSSLPPTCLELYSTVSASNVDLDWTRPGLGVQSRYPLSNAIRHSIAHGELGVTLQKKATKYGSDKKTFLCVTLGKNHGDSMFGPYVLEIWPAKHGSPIHNHGNSFAVIKVVHGGLTIRVYNKQVDEVDNYRRDNSVSEDH
jgi:hypothetical protein